VKKRALVFSDAAIADILEQSEWYVAQSGRPLALRWEKAVTSAVSLISNHPGVGAQCSFRHPELRDVRRTTIRGFPKHLLFYRFDEEEMFVLRVVHGARDLERLFS
jgi:toxin ParE1/3/4